MKITLFTRAGCCLCDDARVALERARARQPFELEVVDIATDPELLARYGQEIPVVFIEAHKAFKFRVDEDELLRRLDRRAGQTTGDRR